MDTMLIVAIIAGIFIPTVSVIVRFIRWYYQIEPRHIREFFANHRLTIRRRVYQIFVLVVTVLVVYAFVSVILLFTFNLGAVMIEVLMFWALLGVWMPAIHRLNNQKIERTLDVLSIVSVVFIFTGFWIIKWPEWELPAVLTLIISAMAILAMVRVILRRRRQNA